MEIKYLKSLMITLNLLIKEQNPFIHKTRPKTKEMFGSIFLQWNKSIIAFLKL